jgi:L-lactate dehydrogenase complex protein LldG
MQTFKTSKSRENILSKIHKNLSQHPLPMPFPEADRESVADVFATSDVSIEETFADAFIRLGGRFIFCENEQDLMNNINSLYDSRGWKQLLCAHEKLLTMFNNNKLNFITSADPAAEKADACITGCEVLVARTGSILLSSKQHLGRVASVFYPVHIVVAYGDQVVADVPQALDLIRTRYEDAPPSMLNLNTGPSRTADIEKTLVVGVHGPGEVFCFYVNA